MMYLNDTKFIIIKNNNNKLHWNKSLASNVYGKYKKKQN